MIKIIYPKDLTGQIIGRWKVLERIEDYITKGGRKKVQWLCECQCEKKTRKKVLSDGLLQGKSLSCGCFAREQTSIRNKKYNKYDLLKGYGVGFTFKDEEFYFDLDDYDLIKNYCWSINTDGYLVSRDIENKKVVLMHRLIMSPKNEFDVDHINHIKHDNRKENLRICKRSQNAMNSVIRSNNSSDITGVDWSKKQNKWRARISINGKEIALGSYDNKEEAIKVRKEAEIKYFGDYRFKKEGNKMKNIIIFGQMGAGKSSVAQYLIENYNYKKLSLGEKIHSECELYGWHDREHLQKYGQMMRIIFHDNIWCDYLFEKTKEINQNIVIDDARQLNEYDYFSNKEYIPVAVITDENKRIARLSERVNYKIDPKTFIHETELQAKECVNKCKIKIYNNGTYEDLVNEIEIKLEKYLEELKGDVQ